MGRSWRRDRIVWVDGHFYWRQLNVRKCKRSRRSGGVGQRIPARYLKHATILIADAQYSGISNRAEVSRERIAYGRSDLGLAKHAEKCAAAPNADPLAGAMNARPLRRTAGVAVHSNHTRHRLKDWRTRQSQYSGWAAINSLWIRVTQPKGLSALAYNPYAISPSADACTVWRFSRTRTIRQSFPVYADLVALDWGASRLAETSGCGN